MKTDLSVKQIATYQASIFLVIAVCLWANALALWRFGTPFSSTDHIVSSKQIARPKPGDAMLVDTHQQPLRYHVSKPFLSSGSTLA